VGNKNREMKTGSREEAAQAAISQQRTELRQIVERAERDGDFDGAHERLKRWKDRTVRVVQDQVHTREAQRLAKKRKGGFVMGEPLRNLIDEAQIYDAFLLALSEEIASHPEQVLEAPGPAPSGVPTAVAPQPGASNAVFIIHGHDELNLLKLKEELRHRWGFEPIVLSRGPGKGRTIIEKFEEEAQRAVFALALFTPDDFVSVEGDEYSQPRPNAIFELGWFYGRLGRNRVCILFKVGTRIHSDLDGISRIEFRESIAERIGEIERELLGAGVLAK
jgi:predicted nucleotide-binding protein